MGVYYFSGFPGYNGNELYHHGILGQKWGVRRYQNPDGSLTTLGKVHYGAIKTGKAIGEGLGEAARSTGRGLKAVGKHKLQKIKNKHPWMMSDEELRTAQNRADMEKRYVDTVRSIKGRSKVKEAVGEILKTGGMQLMRQIGDTAGKKLGERFVETKLQREARKYKEEANLYRQMSDAANARADYDPTDTSGGSNRNKKKNRQRNYNANGPTGQPSNSRPRH